VSWPGVEQVAQVVVWRAYPDPVGCQFARREVGEIPGHDRNGTISDGGGHVHPAVGVFARHLVDQMDLRMLEHLALAEILTSAKDGPPSTHATVLLHRDAVLPEVPYRGRQHLLMSRGWR